MTDPEPKVKRITDSVGEELEVSDQELAAILGGKPPIRKWIIISLSAGAALIAATIIFWGGGWEKMEGFFASAKPDTVKTDSLKGITDHKLANIIPESTNVNLRDISVKSDNLNDSYIDTTINKTVNIEPLSQESKNKDSADTPQTGLEMAVSDSANFPSDDEFFRLLNAEVSPEEMSQLKDYDLEDLLFTPLVPTEPRTRTERRDLIPFYVSPPPIAPTLTEQKETTRTTPPDSLRLKMMIDSLNTQITLLNRDLEASATNTSQLEKRLQRVATASDSLRQREIKKLAKILESMTPEAAAATLRDLSTEEMSDLLFKLKPRQAAKIIQQLPPTVSGQLAAKVTRR
ncbi:MAG: hypothetical protein V2A61_00305 [Calditrichota bacterium]